MDIRQTAHQALKVMQEQGFDEAQVRASVSCTDEVNIAHDQPSLLRSTENHKVELMGLSNGRKASTELNDTSESSLHKAVQILFENVQVAPQDSANAVSQNENSSIIQGPQEADLNLLTNKVQELLEFRAAETPKMHLEGAAAAFTVTESKLVTTGASELTARVGYHSLSAFGSAKDGTDTSSFNFTGGYCDDVATKHASEWFEIGNMLRDTERQVITTGIEENFTGDVVLAPNAGIDLIQWLLRQVGDYQLIADNSVYKNAVGEQIASPLLSINSCFDGPGVCAITADGFAAKPLSLVDNGKLQMLLPSLYGSRKLSIAHKPSLPSGWSVAPGGSSRQQLVSSVKQGALVGRLSMGIPAPNGDFSGVIKNSFLINDGELGSALSEVMISGNVAQMLKNIVAVSKERIDAGSQVLPWIQIANLHFS